MNKQDFLSQLRERLGGLPQNEVEERVSFYGEMIDDRIEDGLPEDEAVAAVGSVDAAAEEILADIPLAKIVVKSMRSKRHLSALEIVFLVVGSPVWLSLLIAVFAVLFSLYVALWSAIVSFWACFAAILGGATGGVLGGTVLSVYGHWPSGLVLIAAGCVCAGLAIFCFYGCREATKGATWLSRRGILWMKRCFIRKGEL